MTRSYISLLALVVAQGLVTAAHAQSEQQTDSGSTETAPPRRGAYEHDGFYLRVGLGFGGFSNELSSDAENDDGEHSRGEITGMASVGEFMLGGAVAPNWIVGGGLWTSTVLVSDFSQRDGDAVPVEMRTADNFTLIGPFAERYFGAGSNYEGGGGFHLQGGLALAVLNGARPEEFDYNDERRVAIGAGVMLGVGYEWWVERQWGLGVLARLTAAGAVESDENDDFWYHGVATFPAFLLTGTYN